ncbi:hypothetical protein PC116_g32304 [Phytophthora cactorum]|nr:hypothetical protein PC116_g32304 [Phytophthora cactorum]
MFTKRPLLLLLLGMLTVRLEDAAREEVQLRLSVGVETGTGE